MASTPPRDRSVFPKVVVVAAAAGVTLAGLLVVLARVPRPGLPDARETLAADHEQWEELVREVRDGFDQAIKAAREAPPPEPRRPFSDFDPEYHAPETRPVFPQDPGWPLRAFEPPEGRRVEPQRPLRQDDF